MSLTLKQHSMTKDYWHSIPLSTSVELPESQISIQKAQSTYKNVSLSTVVELKRKKYLSITEKTKIVLPLRSSYLVLLCMTREHIC